MKRVQPGESRGIKASPVTKVRGTPGSGSTRPAKSMTALLAICSGDLFGTSERSERVEGSERVGSEKNLGS